MKVASPTRPKRLTRQEAKAQTRARLIESADKRFRRLGYEAAKLDDIAEEAGFTKGAMYFHFASKEALFLELLSAALRKHIAELTEVAALATTSVRAFESGVEQFLDRLDAGDDPAALALEVHLASRRNPAAMKQFTDLLLQHQLAVSEFLREYFRITGRKPAVPIEILPATIVAISEGLALVRQAEGVSAAATTGQIIRILVGDTD